MLKRFFIVLFFSFIYLGAKAQFDTSFIKTSIKRCADSLAIGFKTRDWDLYSRYTYPAIIGKVGGKKEFSSFLSQTFNQIPASAWKKYEIGNILQIVKTERDYQAVIDLNAIIEWQGVRVISTSHLIGESWDGGMFWTFFDSENDVKTARIIKPDLSNQLIIPKRMEKMEPLSVTNSNQQKNNPITPGAKNKTTIKAKNKQ